MAEPRGPHLHFSTIHILSRSYNLDRIFNTRINRFKIKVNTRLDGDNTHLVINFKETLCIGTSRLVNFIRNFSNNLIQFSSHSLIINKQKEMEERRRLLSSITEELALIVENK